MKKKFLMAILSGALIFTASTSQAAEQVLSQPPRTVSEVNPADYMGYKGTVTVSARIGKDGKVKSTKIMRTSGRSNVDRAAQDAAKKWTFMPALDQDGNPMECDKIITFNYGELFADSIAAESTPATLTEPPETISAVYPSKSLGYKGTVTVSVSIGKDGKVKSTKIMRTSGRVDIDKAAQDAAKKWTFKPAKDQRGNAMECDKIITFDYKKIFPKEAN